MSLPVPLGVQIKTARATRRITRELRSLSFRSVAPGGFASATFALNRPLSLTPAEIGYFANVYIEDLRSAKVVWEGWIEDLGRGVSSDGEVWNLTAVGTMAHARDKVVPRIWVDSQMVESSWRRSGYTTGRAYRVDYTDMGSDTEQPAINLTFPEGSTVTSSPVDSVDLIYRGIYDCGQKLGRVRTAWVNGSINANRENRIMTRIGPAGSGTAADTDTWSTTPGSLTCSRGGSPAITADHDVANIRISVIAGGSSVVGATAWGEFSVIVIRSLLKDVNGSDITSGYTNNYVLSSEVITDMIGRGDLYLVDAGTTAIETGLAQIDQLANPLGISPADVLDQLMELETIPYLWEILESQSNGKYRFNWRLWPGTARYRADVKDGIDSPGSADGLYNEALVAYTDWAGRNRTTIRTNAVTVLTDAGRTRTLALDITGAQNSAANAQNAGDQALDEHATPPNAGTLTVARPIYDTQAGRTVMPWEIRPGYLISARGINPNANSINTVGRDGLTTFRIVGVDYNADTAAAVLELDSPPVTVARQIADLKKHQRKRRKG